MRPQAIASTLRSASKSTRIVSRTPILRQPINVLPTAATRPYLRNYSATAEGSSTEGDISKKLAEAESAKSDAEKKVTELQAKVEELQKDQLYTRAEIQTLQRRIAEEKAKASEFAITSFARSLLATSDVLTTALAHVPQPIDSAANPSLASLHDGVQMTQKAMHKTFDENGVKKMDLGRGMVFDPNLHEATFNIPPEVAGEKGDGTEWGKGEIVEISKDGWMIGNRVLRPAQVGVTTLE